MHAEHGNRVPSRQSPRGVVPAYSRRPPQRKNAGLSGKSSAIFAGPDVPVQPYASPFPRLFFRHQRRHDRRRAVRPGHQAFRLRMGVVQARHRRLPHALRARQAAGASRASSSASTPDRPTRTSRTNNPMNTGRSTAHAHEHEPEHEHDHEGCGHDHGHAHAHEPRSRTSRARSRPRRARTRTSRTWSRPRRARTPRTRARSLLRRNPRVDRVERPVGLRQKTRAGHIPPGRRGRGERSTARPSNPSAFTRSARWIPSRTSCWRAPASRNSAWIRFSAVRWPMGAAGSTARTGVFPSPRSGDAGNPERHSGRARSTSRMNSLRRPARPSRRNSRRVSVRCRA